MKISEIISDNCDILANAEAEEKKERCDDAISRQAAIDAIYACYIGGKKAVDKAPANDQYAEGIDEAVCAVEDLPPVTPHTKIGHCKNCKHFEYDHVENVDGIMLIVAHEFCKKWGDGCKTNENGYCFLFEPKERKVNE